MFDHAEKLLALPPQSSGRPEEGNVTDQINTNHKEGESTATVSSSDKMNGRKRKRGKFVAGKEYKRRQIHGKDTTSTSTSTNETTDDDKIKRKNKSNNQKKSRSRSRSRVVDNNDVDVDDDGTDHRGRGRSRDGREGDYAMNDNGNSTTSNNEIDCKSEVEDEVEDEVEEAGEQRRVIGWRDVLEGVETYVKGVQDTNHVQVCLRISYYEILLL